MVLVNVQVNASLEELVMALQCLKFDQSWETNIKTELLYETSKYVSKLAGMPVQPNKANHRRECIWP